MARKSASSDRLRLSRFKLNSLLDITMAINANLPTEDLLAKYENILREDLGIGKIMIFMFSEKWDCMLNAGFPDTLQTEISIEKDLLQYDEITFLTAEEYAHMEAVDIVIPVFNNNAPLAYVLIGDIDEEGEGVSPVIKHLNFIQTISNVIIVAIENIRLFQESLRQEALKKELELASRMQTLLIPEEAKLPQNEKLYVTGFYHPHFDIGGDYYDVLMLDEHTLGFCIADVSGKGISAALLMANFQANLRALFTVDIPMEELTHKLNDAVIRSAKGEKFITLFLAKYNIQKRHMEFINAAHNPPVLYDMETGELEMLETSCVGVGMLDDIPHIQKGERQIPHPSKIICYTDGLSELPDDKGNEIGTDALKKHIANTRNIKENIDAMIAELQILEGNTNLFDDVSIVAVEFL